ncbi:MAG: glycine cleavage system protein H [Ktedonobacteraceae bacterium]
MTSLLYRGCEFPDDCYYDVDRDVWLRRDEDGCVTMGMTDPAQAQCGKFVHVRFKSFGRLLQRGQSAATIESAKWVGPFPTPLTGEIIATNEASFKQNILLANKDPYGAGWMIRLKPTRLEEEWSYLLSADLAFARYREKITLGDMHCYRCAD